MFTERWQPRTYFFISLQWYLGDEPDGEEAEDNGVVGLLVLVGHADVCALPQLTLPLVQFPRRRPDVEQRHLGVALDQPPTEHYLPPSQPTHARTYRVSKLNVVGPLHSNCHMMLYTVC